MPAAIGQDRQSAGRQRRQFTEAARHEPRFLDIMHLNNPSLPIGAGGNPVRRRQRGGMRERGPASGFGPAGVQDDDGLTAFRRRNGVDELPPFTVAPAFEIDQNDIGFGVLQQILRQFDDAEIGRVADRHLPAEPAARLVREEREIEGEIAALRNQPDAARRNFDAHDVHAGRQAREPGAVRPDHTGARRAHLIDKTSLARLPVLAALRESAGNQNHGADAEIDAVPRHRLHGVRRHNDDRQIDRSRHVAQTGIRRVAANRIRARMDRIERPVEAPFNQRLPAPPGDLPRRLRCADHGDAFGVEEGVEGMRHRSIRRGASEPVKRRLPLDTRAAKQDGVGPTPTASARARTPSPRSTTASTPATSPTT